MENLPISITAAALAAIRTIRRQKGISAEYALRLGLQGSACEGIFKLGFEVNFKEDDLRQCIDG